MMLVKYTCSDSDNITQLEDMILNRLRAGPRPSARVSRLQAVNKVSTQVLGKVN